MSDATSENGGVAASPRILDLSWGHLRVQELGEGKDFVLYPGGGHTWDWRVNGTQHVPGILPADVQELLDHGATTVVLSLGMDQMLQVDPGTLALLRECGVTVHLAETRKAAVIYNELVASTAVGGLFHSTC